MSTGYKIDFTDQNDNRSFELAPFTTNGPVTPNDETLDTRATDAASTLLMYGKGAPDYGERIQENMLHHLENFASGDEPAFPINGQFWYDTSDPIAPQLRIYNAFKYTIVAGDTAGNQWIAIVPVSATDSDEQEARFVEGKRVTMVDGPTTHNKENKYSILAPGAIVNGSSNIEFQIQPTPTTTRIGWYIGGWEYAFHSNAVLKEDWKLNEFPLPLTPWTITNVPDPTNLLDVTNKNYVDTEISDAVDANNELSELDDTDVVSPADTEILMYNGFSNKWENRPVVDAIVPLAGTQSNQMLGEINMGNNRIVNLGYPIALTDAATMQYVNDTVTGLAGVVPSLLDDLTDVQISSVLDNQILEFSGGQWKNIDPSAFIATNDIVSLNVSPTFTVPVLLPVVAPAANNEAANKKYVDDEIALAFIASGDGVINSLSFDNSSKELSITTTNGGIFNASLSGASGTTSDMTHEILNANQTPQLGAVVGHALENLFYDNADYPDVPLDQVVRQYSTTIGRAATPKPRVVLSTDNVGGTKINLRSTDLGASQIHAPLVGGWLQPYVVGQNRLSVYQNGVKLIASENGRVEVLALDQLGGTEIGLWHGMETGLNNDATVYNINVRVNSGAWGTYGVQGQDAQRMGNLVDALNVVGSPNWSAMLFEGLIHFYSAYPGSGSSLQVANGPGNDLFAALVGNAGTTGTIYIDLTQNIENLVPPVSYGYDEVGRVGFESHDITLIGSPPALGTIYEVIIEMDLFNKE